MTTLPISPSTKMKTKLTHLPHEVLERILSTILDSHPDPYSLNYRSMDNYDHAALLASLNPSIQYAFDHIIQSAHIDWRCALTADEIGAFLRLKTLFIQVHPRADQILTRIIQSPIQLSSLSLHHISLNHNTLKALLTSTLTKLELQFVTLPEDSHVLSQSACNLNNLTELSLRAMPTVDHKDIVSVCNAASKNLSKLSLGYLRSRQISDATLIEIAQTCNKITHLCLDDIRFTTAHGISTLCKSATGRLLSLRLHSTKLQPNELPELVKCFPNLIEFAIEEPSWYGRCGDHVLDAYMICSPTLKTLDIRSIPQICGVVCSTTKYDGIVKNLERISLRRMPNLIRNRFREFLIAENIRELDLRGCLTFHSIGLYVQALAKSKNVKLERLALGSDGHPMPINLGRHPRFYLGNFNFPDMLQSCTHLKEFIWNHPYRMVHATDETMTMQYISFSQVSGITLAKSLKKYCSRLLRVEVNNILPPVRHRAERASCELAFFALEDALPHCDVIIDNKELEE